MSRIPIRASPAGLRHRMKSLRSRLTAAVMLPLLGLALTFGVITCWIIHRTIDSSADRILLASATALGRTAEAGQSMREALLPMAVTLLNSRDTTPPAFSVYSAGRLLHGNRALRPPGGPWPVPEHDTPGAARAGPSTLPETNPLPARPFALGAHGTTVQPTSFRETKLGDRPVRVAMQIRRVAWQSDPLVIQVADYLDERRSYEQTYFLRVASAGVLIVMTGLLLFYGAITWGLEQFASLTHQIEEARRQPRTNVRVDVPQGAPLEARLLASAFNDLMARTESATQSLRQFTANASHQLRTPLTIVRVHADVLARYPVSSPEGATALTDIVTAVDSLERLLSQLIALARLDEQSAASPSLAAFNLTRLAADVLSRRVTHPDSGEMDITFDAQTPDLAALGDHLLAQEIIANLLDNAIRHNHRNGQVTLSIREHEGQCCLEIRDEGPGIAPANIAKVWERFYHAPGPNSQGGSGLGLPIVKSLCERIGAHVSLAPGAGGRGLCATVLFRSSSEQIPTASQPR